MILLKVGVCVINIYQFTRINAERIKNLLAFNEFMYRYMSKHLFEFKK